MLLPIFVLFGPRIWIPLAHKVVFRYIRSVHYGKRYFLCWTPPSLLGHAHYQLDPKKADRETVPLIRTAGQAQKKVTLEGGLMHHCRRPDSLLLLSLPNLNNILYYPFADHHGWGRQLEPLVSWWFTSKYQKIRKDWKSIQDVGQIGIGKSFVGSTLYFHWGCSDPEFTIRYDDEE